MTAPTTVLDPTVADDLRPACEGVYEQECNLPAEWIVWLRLLGSRDEVELLLCTGCKETMAEHRARCLSCRLMIFAREELL